MDALKGMEKKLNNMKKELNEMVQLIETSLEGLIAIKKFVEGCEYPG